MKLQYFLPSFKMESTNDNLANPNFASYQDSKQIFNILERLNKQRATSKLCDVILRISGTEISAHSNVLAAASPYFDTLFSGQELPRVFSQKSPQIVEILIEGDVDKRYGVAVQRVVDFMYTSEIVLDDKVFAHVTEIARIMQMWTIIEFCNLFQQGCLKVKRESSTEYTCKHALTQTDAGPVSLVQAAEKNPLVQDGIQVNQKRGRPRKCAGLFGKKEEKTISDEIESNAEGEEDVAGKNYVPVQVTRSGRRIKRKKFADEVDEEFQQPEADKQSRKSERVGKDSSNTDSNDSEKSSAVLTNDNNDRLREEIAEVSEDATVDRASSLNDATKAPDNVAVEDSEDTASDFPKADPKAADVTNTVADKSDDKFVESDIGIKVVLAESGTEAMVIPVEKDTGESTLSAGEDAGSKDAPLVDANCVEERISYPTKQYRCDPIKEYRCDRCKYSSLNLKEFNDHHRTHLPLEKTCSYCGWVFDQENMSAKDFEDHLKSHTEEPFFCNFCCARFKTRTKLFLHLPKHSKSKPFVCHVCQAGFKWKHALKSHMIVHKKTKDFLCDICGFATAHKTQLKAHHLIHTGDTFKCTEPGCGYQATKRTNLKFHMLTHSNEKPHQCEICGTSFTLEKNMKRHMLLHKNDRPFQCDQCLFSTTRFDKLKEHYYKAHKIGEKPGKKFRVSEYLKYEEMLNEMDGRTDSAENIGDEIETIELQVADETEASAAGIAQILNFTNSVGETIPIQISQQGLLYEIQQYPLQQVSQEVITS